MIPGRLAGLATEKCYAITEDCADIAIRFFGVPRRKVEICPLGVDTDLFHPVAGARDAAERAAVREALGFSASDVVCIYTGRFSEGKNPLLLAQVIAGMRVRGEPYRGLFVGNGVAIIGPAGFDGAVEAVERLFILVGQGVGAGQIIPGAGLVAAIILF